MTTEIPNIYSARAERYGLETPSNLSFEPQALTDSGRHIPIQSTDRLSDAEKTARDRYAPIIADAVGLTGIRETFPEEWAHIPSVEEVSQRIALPGGQPPYSSHPAVNASTTTTEKHIAQVKKLIIPRATKVGRLGNIAVQAIDPEEVDIERLRNKPGATSLGTDGHINHEVYLNVSGEVYEGSSLSQNPKPSRHVNSLVIATRSIWGSAENDRPIIMPRILTICDSAHLLISPRFQEAAAARMEPRPRRANSLGHFRTYGLLRE